MRKPGAKAGSVAKKGAAKNAVKPAVKKDGVAKAVVSQRRVLNSRNN